MDRDLYTKARKLMEDIARNRSYVISLAQGRELVLDKTPEFNELREFAINLFKKRLEEAEKEFEKL